MSRVFVFGLNDSWFYGKMNGLGEVFYGKIMGMRYITLRVKEVYLVSTHNKEIFKC